MSDLINTSKQILEGEVNEKREPEGDIAGLAVLEKTEKALSKLIKDLGTNFDKGSTFDKLAKALKKAESIAQNKMGR